MSALDQIVNVNIALAAAAVQTPSFAESAIFGTSNRFAASTATTGNITNGSPTLSNIANLTGCVPGAFVSGTGIPSGTYILSVTGSTATMSANATASTTGVSITFKDAIRFYSGGSSGLTQMLADGFQNTDPEYVKAEELNEQQLVPAGFYVGSNKASVAQVDTLAVNTATNGHDYVFTLNGTLISFTASDTVQEDILNGLLTAIGSAFPSGAPVTGAVTGTGGSALLTLTSAVPGAPVVYTLVDSLLTHANTVANHTIVSDIQQAQLQEDGFYGVMICSNADGDIEQVAAYIETQFKIFGACTSTAAVATSSSTDMASVMKGKGYKRSFLFFTNEPTEGKEAAWLGGQLPAVPGSTNWAFKALSGCTPDVLTPGQQAVLIGVPEAGTAGKNVNIYQTVGGGPITEMGWMIGGRFIDITVGLDWLQSTIQTNLYSLLATSPKVPYTDKGVSMIMQQVRAAIDQGVANGLIDGTAPITVSAPAVANVSQAQRTARLAPTVSFSCRLAGAFDAVVVQGNVTT